MKNVILAAVLSTMCTGLAHAGASPEDIDLVTGKAQPKAVAGQSATKSAAENTATDSVRLFDFYASDKAAQLRYERDGKWLSSEQSRMSFGFLISEQRDNLFTFGLTVDASPKFLPGLKISVGGKTYAALLGEENSDIFGLGAGIEAAYTLPVEKFPLRLDAAVHYAPDILTFGQSDRIIDWQVNAGLKFRKSITGYVGFRFIQFDTRPGDREVDDRIHVGVRWELGNS